MNKNETPQLSADSPGFWRLRPELRDQIREAEVEFRKAMVQLTATFPAHLAGALQPLESVIPGRFIAGSLALFEEISELKDVAEMVQKSMGARLCLRCRETLESREQVN